MFEILPWAAPRHPQTHLSPCAEQLAGCARDPTVTNTLLLQKHVSYHVAPFSGSEPAPRGCGCDLHRGRVGGRRSCEPVRAAEAVLRRARRLRRLLSHASLHKDCHQVQFCSVVVFRTEQSKAETELQEMCVCYLVGEEEGRSHPVVCHSCHNTITDKSSSNKQ